MHKCVFWNYGYNNLVSLYMNETIFRIVHLCGYITISQNCEISHLNLPIQNIEKMKVYLDMW